MTTDHTIPGEFTRLEVKPALGGPVNPIETAHRALIVALGKMLVGRAVPKIWVNPEPDDFLAVKDYVAAVAAACDLWLQAVGKEARSNALHTFDKSSFQSAFTDAVEGYALYELQAEAEELGDVDRDTRTARHPVNDLNTGEGARGEQRGLTVNQVSQDYVGSNPTPPTTHSSTGRTARAIIETIRGER